MPKSKKGERGGILRLEREVNMLRLSSVVMERRPGRGGPGACRREAFISRNLDRSRALYRAYSLQGAKFLGVLESRALSMSKLLILAF